MLDTKAQQIAGALGLAIVLVATFKGLRPPSYKDPVGILTICYGHIGTITHQRMATIQKFGVSEQTAAIDVTDKTLVSKSNNNK